MFNGHRRRNDLLSAQIGQLCAGFGQVRHASAAAHSGGYRVDQEHKSITVRDLAFAESVRGKGVLGGRLRR